MRLKVSQVPKISDLRFSSSVSEPPVFQWQIFSATATAMDMIVFLVRGANTFEEVTEFTVLLF